MNNSLLHLRESKNEPILCYSPQCEERKLLISELGKQEKGRIEVPLIIGGREIRTGKIKTAIMPHEHGHVIAR